MVIRIGINFGFKGSRKQINSAIPKLSLSNEIFSLIFI